MPPYFITVFFVAALGLLRELFGGSKRRAHPGWRCAGGTLLQIQPGSWADEPAVIVTYAYTVDARQYIGISFVPTQPGSSWRELEIACAAYLTAHPIGSRIAVLYDPQAPATSDTHISLEPAPRLRDTLLLIVACVITFVGVFCACYVLDQLIGF